MRSGGRCAADVPRVRRRPPASIGHSEGRRNHRGGGVTDQRRDEGQASRHPLDGDHRNAQPPRARLLCHPTRQGLVDRAGRSAPVDRAARTTRAPGARVTVRSTMDRLIVNSPYEEPAQYWRYDCSTRLFDLATDHHAGSPPRRIRRRLQGLPRLRRPTIPAPCFLRRGPLAGGRQ